jgi:predicted transcriptional regulator
MSIKPKYSRLIFGGRKHFELRRTPIRVESGDVVVVYESAPVMAVVGAFVTDGVARGDVEHLWVVHGREFGVTALEYSSYFAGARTAHAIKVRKVVQVSPVPLDDLRGRFCGFRPPQSYAYWTRGLDALLGPTATRKLASGSRTQTEGRRRPAPSRREAC